jgi:polysaccharide export outer membrane protein
VDIFVFGREDLKTSTTILPDGSISVPVAGKIKAEGLTDEQLQTVLAKKYSSIVVSPEVTVTVHPALNSLQVSVIGSVKTPGHYEVSRGERVIDVLAAAGGTLLSPGYSHLTLVHQGGVQAQTADLGALLEQGDMSQNYEVSPGDVIIVTSDSNDKTLIQVLGEVAKPGPIPVPKEGAKLVEALMNAGGALPDAALSQTQILHDGQVRNVDLSKIKQNLADFHGDERVYPGDVIQVPLLSGKIFVLGSVNKPDTYNLPDGKLETSVTSVVFTAGGLTGDADSSKSSIVHTDKTTGKVTETPVDLKSIFSGKTKDIALYSGDVLIVPTKGQQTSSTSSMLGLGAFGLSLLTFLK